MTAQFRAVPRVGQRELDERLEVRIEVADVVPAFVVAERHAVHASAAADDGADRVGELDLAALAGRACWSSASKIDGAST